MAPSDFCILSLWGAAAATAGHRPSCPPAQDTGRQFPHPPAHPIPCSSYRGKRTRCSGIGHNKQDSVLSQKSLPLLAFCIRTETALPAMQMPLYMLSIAKNPARCNPKRRACAQKRDCCKMQVLQQSSFMYLLYHSKTNPLPLHLEHSLYANCPLE